MRVLVINPNTSSGVTRVIAEAAGAAASREDVIETMAAPFGPELIVTEDDSETARRAVGALVDKLDADFDGIVIASFGDTGIADVRARISVPVVGIARCSFLAALAVGEKFSIVSFSPTVEPSLRAVVEANGFSDRLASVRVLQKASWSDAGKIGIELLDPLIDLCVRTQDDGCEAIVMGGGPLSGLAQKIAPHVRVPVIDGVSAAICMLRALRAPVDLEGARR